MYDQTKRRKTTHAAGKKKSTAQASQADNGSGKGRVALEHTIVVGRVYVLRMGTMGMEAEETRRTAATWVAARRDGPLRGPALNPPFPQSQRWLHNTIP